MGSFTGKKPESSRKTPAFFFRFLNCGASAIFLRGAAEFARRQADGSAKSAGEISGFPEARLPGDIGNGSVGRGKQGFGAFHAKVAQIIAGRPTHYGGKNFGEAVRGKKDRRSQLLNAGGFGKMFVQIANGGGDSRFMGPGTCGGSARNLRVALRVKPRQMRQQTQKQPLRQQRRNRGRRIPFRPQFRNFRFNLRIKRPASDAASARPHLAESGSAVPPRRTKGIPAFPPARRG